MILMKEEKYLLAEIIVPIMFVSVCTYCICTIFFGLYEEIVLALLLSIAIDKNQNNDWPQYGSRFIHDGMDQIYQYHAVHS
jgi:hypothetical protein